MAEAVGFAHPPHQTRDPTSKNFDEDEIVFAHPPHQTRDPTSKNFDEGEIVPPTKARRDLDLQEFWRGGDRTSKPLFDLTRRSARGLPPSKTSTATD